MYMTGLMPRQLCLNSLESFFSPPSLFEREVRFSFSFPGLPLTGTSALRYGVEASINSDFPTSKEVRDREDRSYLVVRLSSLFKFERPVKETTKHENCNYKGLQMA